MKFLSWNVNGIRAAIRKGFLDVMAAEDPDIICIQETKARPEQVDLELSAYKQYWNSAEKKGYSGTAIFTKIEPNHVIYDIDIPRHDKEGRVITLEFDDYFLTTVYTPNSKRGLKRLAYRQKEWDVDFLEFVKNLEREKPVIFCGDLNVAHKEIDLARPESNRRNAGFTDEEREGMDNIIAAGFIDTFRQFNTDGGHYTWWAYWGKARERNVGWRIDYFLISSELRPRLKDAFILPDVMGSDHCPVGIILE
jgi:exodeoxyribonuclease-3